MKTSTATVLAFGTAMILATAPAFAQKSKGVMRLVVGEPIKAVDTYFDPKSETGLSVTAVFDRLLHYDDRDGKFKPQLAKSWKRTSPTSIEYELRDDIIWHDGEKFDADDVVYTLNWLIDKKTKLRFKRNFLWMKTIEKISPHKVRITGKKPFALDLYRVAFSNHIFPEHIHAKLKNKAVFGVNPVGTGIYKAVAVNKNKGITLEVNPAAKHGGEYWKPSNVKRFQITQIPDMQTQVAHLLTGGVDVVRDLPADQVNSLRGKPGLAVTASTNLVYIYF